jgi:hypothetical protein
MSKVDKKVKDQKTAKIQKLSDKDLKKLKGGMQDPKTVGHRMTPHPTRRD